MCHVTLFLHEHGTAMLYRLTNSHNEFVFALHIMITIIKSSKRNQIHLKFVNSSLEIANRHTNTSIFETKHITAKGQIYFTNLGNVEVDHSKLIFPSSDFHSLEIALSWIPQWIQMRAVHSLILLYQIHLLLYSGMYLCPQSANSNSIFIEHTEITYWQPIKQYIK